MTHRPLDSSTHRLLLSCHCGSGGEAGGPERIERLDIEHWVRVEYVCRDTYLDRAPSDQRLPVVEIERSLIGSESS